MPSSNAEDDKDMSQEAEKREFGKQNQVEKPPKLLKKILKKVESEEELSAEAK